MSKIIIVAMICLLYIPHILLGSVQELARRLVMPEITNKKIRRFDAIRQPRQELKAPEQKWMNKRIQELKNEVNKGPREDRPVNYKILPKCQTFSDNQKINWEGFSCYGKNVYIMTSLESLDSVPLEEEKPIDCQSINIPVQDQAISSNIAETLHKALLDNIRLNEIIQSLLSREQK